MGFLYTEPDSAFELTNELISFAEDKKYPRGLAVAYNMQGVVSSNKGDYSKAMDYYTSSLEMPKEAGDKTFEAIALGNIALSYDEQGKNRKAMEYYGFHVLALAATGLN